MSISPLGFTESLCIGTVESVSPDEIRVLLTIDAPNSVALNTGTPRPFPRVNNYVLIPSDQGYVVGQVEWLTIERSAYPKRIGMQDFGLVDLPYPSRKMSLNPLGILFKSRETEGKRITASDVVSTHFRLLETAFYFQHSNYFALSWNLETSEE